MVAESGLFSAYTSSLSIGGRHRRETSETFVWLMTSGTTGAPKLCRVTQSRAVLSAYCISSLCMALSQDDAVYCVLPFCHATGLLLGMCASIYAGCTLISRQRFAARGFWSDVVEQQATVLIYVGDVCRILLAVPDGLHDQKHRIRLACGNGMALDIWHRFQAKFRIPKIVEFYGATELPLALVNLGGHPGAVGRILLARYSPWRIISYRPDTGDLQRDNLGLCRECEANEPGELVLLLDLWRLHELAGMNEDSVGWHDDRHVVANLIVPGDEALRTGDTVVRDATGYVRYVDRLVDTFRQDGRNVSGMQVVWCLRRLQGIVDVCVTHLRLAHYDGQCGLTLIVPGPTFDLQEVQRGYEQLPAFARPRFLRLARQPKLTPSFKFDRATLRAEGVDPQKISDPLYVYCKGRFLPVTHEVWHDLSLGRFRF
jgi:fatty-acyl-CoA synthase